MPDDSKSIFWSIGLVPVQDWISAARRSRDLRVGSAYLSWVMARILVFLEDELKATILVPSVGEAARRINGEPFPSLIGRSNYSIPNRASGRISDSSVENVKCVFSTLQHKADEAWSEIVQQTQQRVTGVPAIMRPHLANAAKSPGPIQVIWVTQEVEDRSVGLAAIDRFFAAVKRSRSTPHHQGAPVGKCGQCGRREAIGPQGWNNWRDFHDDLEKTPEIVQAIRFDAGERLCGICCTKRLMGYLSLTPYPSTSQIAAREWLYRVRNCADLSALLTAIRGIPGFDDPSSDTHPLLYKRTLDRHIREEATAASQAQGTGPSASDRHQKLTGLRESLRKVQDAARERGLRPSPSNYLAVLAFDGDDMGRKVREHSEALSRQVQDFAKDLCEVVVKKRAELFYIGGDEGLLLSPIEPILALADEIHQTWTKWLPEGVTLSMGISLFDRERPLGSAIQTSRNALRLAKSQEEKNSLAITVQTASGNEFSAVEPWGAGWKRLSAAMELVQEGNLSSGWAYDIERLLASLPAEAWVEARDAIRQEVQRVTFRRIKAVEAPDTTEAEKTGESVETGRIEIWNQLLGESWWTEQPDPGQLKTLSNQLHLISFVARESSIAPADEREDQD
jgi:CRISPR-associated protein Cmr2